MTYKVFWTPEAEDTFNQNILYLQYKWNEAVIENFIAKTEEAIDTIRANPLLFPLINKKKRVHKCLVVRQVSLYYRVVENRIYLITFWNNYQDPDKLTI
jgi:plasmid stabilization system protein ParE